MANLPDLIDKTDNFEVVRDLIATILAAETISQQALAVAAAEDPKLWAFDVFIERSNPFETLKGFASANPVVNVWFDTSSADRSRSNQFERQYFEATYNIDVIARGDSAKVAGTGHISGDEQAFRNAQRVARLVRNILMAAQYRFLGVPRGPNQVVLDRWVDGMESYRPDPEKPQSSPNIGGIRISFGVGFNEFDPQIPLSTIDLINIQVFRDSDGKLILESEIT